MMRLKDMFGDLGKLLCVAAELSEDQSRRARNGQRHAFTRELDSSRIHSSSRFCSRPLETHCQYLRGQSCFYRSFSACQIRTIVGGGECLRLLVIERDVPFVDF